MPHWPKTLGRRSKKFGLESIKILLERLGNPQNNVPPVIYVGGTNGKGSTISFIRHIINAAGYRSHVYISPHLKFFNERIILADHVIGDDLLYDVLEECRRVSHDLPVTFFEGTTAAAFLAFTKVKADFLLLEVGCGGRLDATNVVGNVLLSIITSIDYDHMEILGSTIQDIAREKSYIMRPGGLCIVGKQCYPESSMVLEDYAVRNKVRVYRHGYEWKCYTEDGYMRFCSGNDFTDLPLPSLLGEHQVMNAGNAVAACTMLSYKYGVKIEHEHLVSGLKKAKWEARLEPLIKGPLFEMLPSKNWVIYLDGAHNNGGAKVLNNWMKGKSVFLVVGMTKGRDTKQFLEILKPGSVGLCAVCVHSEPRSQSSSSIYRCAQELGFEMIFDCESVAVALHRIIESCYSSYKDQGLCILICGSLFLAGDVIKDFS